jgi:hypothetical protein
MPMVFETGDKVGRLRVVQRVRRGYRCRCAKCNRVSEVSGRALRLKHAEVNCLRCFPRVKLAPAEIFRTLRGWPTVNDMRDAA